MRKLSRRQFLILSAGTSTVMMGVVQGCVSDEGLIIEILKTHIPFSSSDKSILMKYAKDYTEKYKAGSRRKAAAIFNNLYFSKNMRALMPETFKMRIQKLERSVITEFVLNSNAEKYFGGIDQTLVYNGLPMIKMCNPFAILRAGVTPAKQDTRLMPFRTSYTSSGTASSSLCAVTSPP